MRVTLLALVGSGALCGLYGCAHSKQSRPESVEWSRPSVRDVPVSETTDISEPALRSRATRAKPKVRPRPVPTRPAPPRSARPLGLYELTQANFRGYRPFQRELTMDGTIDQARLNAAVFHVTNERRAQAGLPLVRYHRLLEVAAMGHARRMATLGFFSHHDPTDARFATTTKRGRAAGIASPAIAENIHSTFSLRYAGGPVYPLGGRGQFSTAAGGPPLPMHTYLSFADAVVQAWMNSPGHRDNILHRDARQLGVGVALHWQGDWPYAKAVQNFQFFKDILPRD